MLVTLIAQSDGFSSAGVEWLPAALNVGLHLFLVTAFVGFAFALYGLATENSPSPRARAMRALAVFVGALVVVGSQARGTSYTTFVFDSLADARTPFLSLFGSIVPGAAGLALGYWFTRGARQGGSSERATRALLLIGSFCLVQFAVVYALAIESAGVQLDASVTPNVAFVAGLALYLVFNLDVGGSSDGDLARRFKQLLGGGPATGRSAREPRSTRSAAERFGGDA